MNDAFELHRGSTPLVVSVPHAGTAIPDDLRFRYMDQALAVADTDWFVDRIYGFAPDLGASLIVPRMSRYVIDLNRSPENTPMYPGANNTELCPTCSFDGDRLYRDGHAPDAAEIARRIERYWQPYHDALAAELERAKVAHGYAILLDGHSIKSRLPWLFEGTLPDLNLGTAGATSCASTLRAALMRVLEVQTTFTQVTDGRFKGGHITRHYGRPASGVHAVQLEICWSCYMREERPYVIDAARAERLAPVLRALVDAMLEWKPGP